MLRSKIHRATLTGTDIDYEGSIAIDRLLIDAAQLLPGEQVHVLNVNNGLRLVTYVIEAPAGSGVMLLNGPAARLAVPGDKVVILSYSGNDGRRSPHLAPDCRLCRREESADVGLVLLPHAVLRFLRPLLRAAAGR